MALWDLVEIRRKVRQVTGRFSPDVLSNSELDKYINKYFQFTFPAEVKLDRFHTFYELLTVANQRSYNLPTGYVNFEPPATIDRLALVWYQEPSTFEDQNPQNIQRQTPATGDGVTVGFNLSATGLPLLPGSVVITDNNEVFEDVNTDFNINPVIAGSLGGTATVNYTTGAITVTFNTAPANGQQIFLSYVQFQAGLPVSVLLYNNQFTFYPVPDTAYRFKVKAYSNVLVTTAAGGTATEFINASDRPLLDEWGPAIAYGTAREIFSDYGELDTYAQITQLYREQLAYISRRTHQNLLNVRANPHF